MFLAVFICRVHLIQANNWLPYVGHSLYNVLDVHDGDLTVRRALANDFRKDDSEAVYVRFLGWPDYLIEVNGSTACEFGCGP